MESKTVNKKLLEGFRNEEEFGYMAGYVLGILMGVVCVIVAFIGAKKLGIKAVGRDKSVSILT